MTEHENVEQEPEDSASEKEARRILESKAYASLSTNSSYRHAVIASAWSQNLYGGPQGELTHVVEALSDRMDEVATGNTKRLSNMLTAQAITLDTLFTELTRRAGINMGEYPQAAERYMRLALKAQSNSRATIEAIVNLHRPREQIVKHVTVHEGGQAVVTDEFHHHATGGKNEKFEEQPHAADEPGECTSLPSPNPLGETVPIPSNAERPMSHARRAESRRAQGE